MKKILCLMLTLAIIFCPFAVGKEGVANADEYENYNSFTPGDLDYDGEVTLTDIVTLAQYIAEWNITCNEEALDPNGDYNCTLDDIVHLAQYVAQWQDIILNPEPYTPISDDYDYDETLRIYNSEEPITTQYRGMSGSVYHAFGHIQDDITGRVYTEDMLNLELDRLKDSGVRYARTRFDSHWFWDNNTYGYNWDQNRARYFYDYCRNLADRDINVVLSVGWHLGCFTHVEGSSIDEISYITKSENYQTDVYGETAGYDFSKCKDDNYKRMAKEALRFGYFYAQALKQAKARGINNISHLLYFTEPSYSTSVSSSSPAYGKEGPSADEYIFIVQTIQQKLKDEGVYEWVDHVGPNQGSIPHGDGLLRYMLERDNADMFDVWTAHFYPEAIYSTDNIYYDICDPVFESYMQTLKDTGIYGKKEFWVDEFYARSDNASLGVDNAWNGLQTVIGAITAQQRGINNISLWMVFDQLWTDNTYTGGEFQNGIHACGSAPSLFISDVPKGQYYPVSLFAKYNGYQNGKAYRTNNDDLKWYGDIHVGATQLEDGTWTVTVVNAGFSDYKINVVFEKAINQTLYRHTTNVNTLVPTSEAKLAGVGKVFNNVTTDFTDIINGGSVVIYTGVKDF